jgi:hypothetical protein
MTESAAPHATTSTLPRLDRSVWHTDRQGHRAALPVPGTRKARDEPSTGIFLITAGTVLRFALPQVPRTA